MATSDATEDADARQQDEFAPQSKILLAAQDIADGLSDSWMWLELAIRDIKNRYRGSILGPFWFALSTALQLCVIGFIYTNLLNVEPATYIPYLGIGLVIWQFISSTLTGGCQTFIGSEGIMQQARLPLSLHAFRLVCRQMLIFAHTCLLIPLIMLLYGVSLPWTAVLAIPGVVMLAFNALWVSILFGMASARFRDIPPIVASLMQVAFFITPIFWFPDRMGQWETMVQLNPLYTQIDVIRAPLLGVPIAEYSWPILIGLTIIGSLMTFLLFARYRPRIVFWT